MILKGGRANQQNLTGKLEICAVPGHLKFKSEVEKVGSFSNGEPQATAWPWRDRARE